MYPKLVGKLGLLRRKSFGGTRLKSKTGSSNPSALKPKAMDSDQVIPTKEL
jgi:hypothetical protein